MKKSKTKIEFVDILNAIVLLHDPEPDYRFEGGLSWGIVCDFHGKYAALWANHTANPPTDADQIHLESIRHQVAEEVASMLEMQGYKVKKEKQH